MRTSVHLRVRGVLQEVRILEGLAVLVGEVQVDEPGLDRIHDRQPVVLDRVDWATWLDPDLTDPDDVFESDTIRQEDALDGEYS